MGFVVRRSIGLSFFRVIAFGVLALSASACAPKFNFHPSLQGLSPGCSGNPTLATLSSIYPVNGRNWMDWVHVSDTSLDSYSQTDVACAGTESNEWSCIHGGEKLEVPVPSLSSCSGVTAQDALGAFDWVCEVKSGEAYIYSSGLQEFKGLKDLINTAGTAFLENSVAVYQNGCEVASTNSGTWWNNSFVVLTSNAGDGLTSLAGSAGTIYTLPMSSATAGAVSTDGFNLDGNQQALVVMDGVTLQYSGASTDNVDENSGKSDGGNDITAIASSGSESFQWIEGVFNGTPTTGTQADFAVDTRRDNFMTYRASTYENSNSEGLLSWTCQSCLYEDLTAINNPGGGSNPGIFDDTGSGGFLKDIYSANNGSGIAIGETNGFAENIYTANNADSGISYGGGTLFNASSANDNVTGITGYGGGGPTDDIVVEATSTNSGDYAIQLYGNDGDTFLGVTVANAGLYGILLNGSPTATDNTFVNSAESNSPTGIYINGATNEYFDEVSVTNNSTGIKVDTSSTGNDFENYLLLGNNSSKNCSVSGAGADPGVVTTTCTSGGGSGAGTYGSGGSTANWGGGGNLSTAYLYTGFTVANSFMGKVTTTDTANSTNTLGAETYSTNLDWFDFSTIMRAWGVDGGTFPTSSNRGNCSSTNTGCRIWDWRLSHADTVLRNTSGTGMSQNDAFVPGAACPQAVNGNTAITDQAGHTFLPNAYEITFDFTHNPTGNNNGLCESGEACIYMPNIGAYQGEGDPFSQAPCVFQNGTGPGTVSDVTMYAYPTNGD